MSALVVQNQLVNAQSQYAYGFLQNATSEGEQGIGLRRCLELDEHEQKADKLLNKDIVEALDGLVEGEQVSISELRSTSEYKVNIEFQCEA